MRRRKKPEYLEFTSFFIPNGEKRFTGITNFHSWAGNRSKLLDSGINNSIIDSEKGSVSSKIMSVGKGSMGPIDGHFYNREEMAFKLVAGSNNIRIT
jgi:hypothetical protein